MAPGKTRSIVCSARNFFQFSMPGKAWWQVSAIFVALSIYLLFNLLVSALFRKTAVKIPALLKIRVNFMLSLYLKV